jgi:hypothetical protein
MTPLSADDVADVVDFVATRPSHVDVDQLVLRPRDQARVGLVSRRGHFVELSAPAILAAGGGLRHSSVSARSRPQKPACAGSDACGE